VDALKGRRAWLARVIPATLLVFVYVTLAFSKVVTAIKELTESDGAGWAERLLLTLFMLSGAAFFWVVGLLTLSRKEPIRRQTRLIGWLLPLAPTVAMAVIGVYEPRDFPVGVMLVATFFVVAGTLFTFYSLRHLGRHFGYVSDVRGLVTSGPYAWVRHPLYGGEALTMIGLVIAVANPVTVTAFVVGMALQIWRAKVEEQALTAAFPEYGEYAARTPMLIPLMKLPSRPVGSVQPVE
jgi:protein-S-isoprenylcysteine O-methyltransferase Ste14